MAQLSRLPSEQSEPVPPIADWLEGLSHDSSFEPQPGPAIGDRTIPQLSAVPGLVDLLKNPDRNVRSRAATVLGKVGCQAQWALKALRAALKETALHDLDEEVRTTAVHAVLQAGPPAGKTAELGELIDSFQDELAVVRFHAAVALGDLGREARQAVAPLVHVHLWDEDPGVRVEAGVALWKIDRKGALVVPNLAKALSDPNEVICWLAADSLGEIGPEASKAAPALQQALERNFQFGFIKTAITLALQRINAQPPDEAG